MNKFGPFGYILLIVCLFSTLALWAQAPEPTEAKLFSPKSILPAPVNAATLNKGGDVNVNLSTGTPNVSIPLFNVQSRFLSIGISVNYSSNGIKVNDMPGVVGLGWSLNCGGVISRTTFGYPDEERQSNALNNFTKTNFNTWDRASLAYLEYQNDRESDVYDISVNGFISGRFILDQQGNPKLLDDKNLRIIRHSRNDSIVVLDDKGIRYCFSVADTSSYERGGIYCTDDQSSRIRRVTNAWYLSSMILPGQDTIRFSYITNQYTYLSDANETESICSQSDYAPCGSSPSAACQVNSSTYETCLTTQRIWGKLLKRIDFNNGKLTFDYDHAREDNYGGLALTGVTLYNEQEAVKYVGLSYRYFTSSDNNGYLQRNGYSGDRTEKRLVLDQIKIASSAASLGSAQVYKFDYNNGDKLPPRLSGAQDHFGYYNGKNDNSYLLTSIKEYDPTTNYYELGYPRRYGDRDMDTAFMFYGTLSKVTYPTGGYDTIQYDYNRTKKQFIDRHEATYMRAIMGEGITGVKEIVGNVNMPYEQLINVNFHVKSLDENMPIEFIRKKGTLTIRYLDKNVIIFSKTLIPINGQFPDTVRLLRGAYEVKLTAESEYIASNVEFDYFSQLPDTAIRDVPLGGLSVRRLISYDPFARIGQQKEYRYIQKEDSSHATFRLLRDVTYMTTTSIPKFFSCGSPMEDCTGDTRCQFIVHSSSAVSPYTALGSSPTYHTSVIESTTGADQITRAVETRYMYEALQYPGVVNGGYIPNTPYGIYPEFLMGDTLTTYYTVDPQGKRNTQKLVRKTYENTGHHVVYNYNVTKSWQPPCHFDPPREEEFRAYNINDYPIIFKANKLLSVEEKTFDDKGAVITTLSSNDYTKGKYVLLRQQTIRSSTGQQLSTTYKYTWEEPVNDVFSFLERRNNIALPTVVSTLVNGNAKETQQTAYTFSNLTDTVAQAYRFTSTSVLPGLTAEAQITGFNRYGKVQDYQKGNDVSSFLWDYKSCYLVANVEGANSVSTAYTGFEADYDGRWKVPSSLRNRTDMMTGRAAYNLSLGAITTVAGAVESINERVSARTSIIVPGGYIVSYWSKGGPATVNSSAAALKISKDGWSLYEHLLPSNTTNVSVSGNVIIDELRLHPVNARMSTYVYRPLVGIVAQGDTNNRITFYEYDEFNRLKIVRDHNGKILKQINYQYQAPVQQ